MTTIAPMVAITICAISGLEMPILMPSAAGRLRGTHMQTDEPSKPAEREPPEECNQLSVATMHAWRPVKPRGFWEWFNPKEQCMKCGKVRRAPEDYGL